VGPAVKGGGAEWTPLLAGQTLSLTQGCLDEDAGDVVAELLDEAKDALMGGLEMLSGE